MEVEEAGPPRSLPPKTLIERLKAHEMTVARSSPVQESLSSASSLFASQESTDGHRHPSLRTDEDRHPYESYHANTVITNHRLNPNPLLIVLHLQNFVSVEHIRI